MPVKELVGGIWYVDGQKKAYKSREEAEAAEAHDLALSERLQGIKEKGKVAMAPTPEQRDAAIASGQDIVWDDASGTYKQVPLPPEQQQAFSASGIADANALVGSGRNAAPVLPLTDPGAQRAPVVSDPLANAQGRNTGVAPPSGFGAVQPAAAQVAPRATPTPGHVAVSSAPITAAPGAAPPATQAAAPQADTTKLDNLLRGVGSFQQQLAELALDSPEMSKALAQLQVGLQASQASALSLARTGDASNRSAALRGAVDAGVDASGKTSADAALVRATEEDQDRRFRADAIKSAADLGLNTAALQLDVSKINLDSVMQIVNRQFEQLGIDKQLSQQEADSLRNYARDMAAIQQEYDRLGSEEQRFVSEQLLKKYQIDQQTANNLEVARIGNKERPWYQELLTQFVGGAVGGAAEAGTSALVSDVTAKRDVRKVSDGGSAAADLDELLSTIKASTYVYRDQRHGKGLQLGVMAQDLQRSRAGRAMVTERGPDGYLRVDGGRAALAGLAAVASLAERVRELENG